MKPLYLFVLLPICFLFVQIDCVYAQAPNVIWANHFTGYAYEEGRAIDTDSSGNVYTVGNFDSSVDFDPGASTFSLTAFYDVFITKFDSAGNFLWAKSIGGNSLEYTTSVRVDDSGFIYITGSFTDTADFDPGSGIFELISYGIGSTDCFVLKLDLDGNFIWVQQFGGSGSDHGNGLVIHDSGNIFVCGTFNGIGDFDPGPGILNLNSSGLADVFIFNIDSSGTLNWATSFGGIAGENVLSIATDSIGNVFTSGSFEGTADFNPGAGIANLVSSGAIDMFISKLDNSGNYLWAKQIGGTANDVCTGLAIGLDGNVFTSGNFSGLVDFDPNAGIYNFTSAGSSDMFIMKLDSSGNLVWVKQIGGNSTDWISVIAVNDADHITCAGWFQGTADFDPGISNYNLSATGSNKDIFIAKYNGSGNFVWARTFNGQGSDFCLNLKTNNENQIYLTGYFASPILSLGNMSLSNSDVTGVTWDAFIVKLESINTGEIEFTENKKMFVFPNPADDFVNIILPDKMINGILLMIDLTGRPVFTFQEPVSENIKLPLNHVSDGLYILRFQNSDSTITQKLVVKKRN